jgi:hypothetical protein
VGDRRHIDLVLGVAICASSVPGEAPSLIGGAGSPGGGDEVADKKITPKAAKKSTAKASKTEPAARVTKRLRHSKRARKGVK